MTDEQLQQRCTDLEKRIGPKASAVALIYSSRMSLMIEPGPHAPRTEHFEATTGFEAAFAAAEAWLASRPDPDAEWRSWQVAA